MKTTLSFLLLAALTLPLHLTAAVSDEDFQKLQQQLQKLQSQREQDRKEIDQLKQKLGETEKTAATAQQTASEAVAKAQAPVNPVPSEEASAKHNFLITGYASALYDKQEGKNGGFLLGSFSPILLFRASDKILFESELEFGLSRNEEGEAETETELEYAQIDYAFNDYLTFIGGKFLLPLGQFPEKLHPAWINKLPTMPIVYTGVGNLMHDEGILPFSDIGVQARGAMHLGPSDAVLSYSTYLVNGPGANNDGELTFEDALNMMSGDVTTSGTPSGGGRLAVFYPWTPYHDFELGISGQTGTWDANNDLLWSAVVADAAVHLGPYTELRGEYVHTFQENGPGATIEPQGAYAQIAYKLAGLHLDWPLINNCEAVFRYDYLDTDGRDETPGGRAHGYALGLNYYITNTLLVKGAYEFIDSTDKEHDNNRLTLQMAYGF